MRADAHDRPMTVTATTDPARVAALLERRLAVDPVRATVLGSILAELRAGRTGEPWCAQRVGTDVLVVRSGCHYPALFTAGWDGADLASAIELVGGLSDLAGVSGPADTVEVAVAGLAGYREQHRVGLRLFRLDELTLPAGVVGEPRPATVADRDLIVGWYRAFGAEAGSLGVNLEEAVDRSLGSGRVWLWRVDDHPVSLAARRPAEAGSARVGPVYTPPAERGHGYGSAVTAVATRDILDLGAIPVLFTDLANPTSNKIYQALGYYSVEDRLQVTFAAR
jgi:GNAT superfamily N-acetyltransferase